MNRARMLGSLLAFILLACAVVIFLDQKGAFGNSSGTGPAVSTPAGSGSAPVPTPQPSGSGGYGDLK